MYKLFTFIITVYFYLYNTMYINTHLSVIVPKSNPPLLAYLIWCSSSPLLALLYLLTNYSFPIYTALGGIAK